MFGFYKSFEKEERLAARQYLNDAVLYNSDLKKDLKAIESTIEKAALSSASLKEKVEYILTKGDK